MAKGKTSAKETSTANIGFEAKLWLTADSRSVAETAEGNRSNNMDAAEYSRAERDRSQKATRRVGAAAPINHVVLGLIFLKYISDSFEEHRARLLAGQGDYAGANPEDPDEPSGARQTAAGSPKGERGGANQYKAENVFWVPAEARWSHLQASAKQPTIGKLVDDAMVAIERDNLRLKGVLPKDYARPGLDTASRDSALSPRPATPQSLSAAKDNQRLGELIDVIATIELTAASEGEKTHRSVDLLGRVYEYFLTRFASAESKNGGPGKCEVRSASVEVKTSGPFVNRHWSFVIPPGPEHADTFRRDLHPDLRADTATRASAKLKPRSQSAGLLRSERQLLANPPFNDSDTALRDGAFLQSEAKPQVVSEAKDNFRKDDDVRWQPSGARQIAKGNPQGERGGVHQFGVPPRGNANFAWVQHLIHHLAPQGVAGFVLANGSMSSNQSGDCPARSASAKPKAKPQSLPRQRDIRRALIEADLVDCMVALPGQLFYSTPFWKN
jgi:type I restriction enzyme M protein